MSQTKAQLIDTLVASLLPASDSAVDIGSNAVRFANIYGDTLYGNGANLTGINTDLVSDTSPQLGGNLDVNTKNILFGDSSDGASDDVLIFGAGSDLKIYHGGSNSVIAETGTGNLELQTNSSIILQKDNSEFIAKFISDGACELYYDNSKKAETDSFGFEVFGEFRVGSATHSHTHFNYQDGGNNYITQGNSSQTFFRNASGTVRTQIQTDGHWRWKDGIKAEFGDSDDLQIYHNATNSLIENVTGNLIINSAGELLLQKYGTGESMVRAVPDNTVELRYDNSKKLETTSTGVTVSGELTVTSNLLMGDGDKLRLGDSNDLELHHSSGENYIQGHLNQLYIRSAQGIYIQPNTNENGVVALANQGVKLYYDNSEKIETRPTGLRMQNNSTLDVNNGLIKFGHCSSAGTDDTLMFGANGNDLEIFHGGNSQIDNNTGNIEIRNTGDFSSSRNIHIRARVDENYINAYSDGAVKLYYDSSLKFETTSAGIDVTGRVTTDELTVQKASGNLSVMVTADNGLGTMEIGGSTGAFIDLKSPTSDDFDFRIGTDGTAGYILAAGTGIISIQGHPTPAANNTYDLGTTSVRWRNIYTNDLHLSNEGHSNDVDGTWGSYTIQEGAEDLFLVNKRSGKKYKFNLTEVS